jgi:hypothetical protein
MPDGAVYVGRPTRWGNPFTLHGDWIVWTAVALGFTGDVGGRRAAALALYRSWLTGKAPKGQKPHGNCGAITYESGKTVETSEHVMGFAATVSTLMTMPTLPPKRPVLDELRGKDLACWCRLDQPCHADVLLELANKKVDNS